MPSETSPDPIPAISKSLRVSISAKTAGNLPELQRSLEIVATHNGHPRCVSGCDRFFFSVEGEVARDSKVAQRSVFVSLPQSTNGNIVELKTTIANIMGKLGCLGCCSGFDIEFATQIAVLVADTKGNVVGFGSNAQAIGA